MQLIDSHVIKMPNKNISKENFESFGITKWIIITAEVPEEIWTIGDIQVKQVENHQVREPDSSDWTNVRKQLFIIIFQLYYYFLEMVMIF